MQIIMIYISNYFMHVYSPVRGSLLCYPRLAFAQLTLAIHSIDSATHGNVQYKDIHNMHMTNISIT